MLEDSIREYERKHKLRLIQKLGDGKDGYVLSSDHDTAVKFFRDAEIYNRELRNYRLIMDAELNDAVLGHQVPRLIDHDDALNAIEMTIVAPPFLLDFAAAYTEEEVERFGFDADVMAERQAHWEEVFGERWPHVEALREVFLRHTGLVLLDLSLNNIRFE